MPFIKIHCSIFYTLLGEMRSKIALPHTHYHSTKGIQPQKHPPQKVDVYETKINTDTLLYQIMYYAPKLLHSFGSIGSTYLRLLLNMCDHHWKKLYRDNTNLMTSVCCFHTTSKRGTTENVITSVMKNEEPTINYNNCRTQQVFIFYNYSRANTAGVKRPMHHCISQ